MIKVVGVLFQVIFGGGRWGRLGGRDIYPGIVKYYIIGFLHYVLNPSCRTPQVCRNPVFQDSTSVQWPKPHFRWTPPTVLLLTVGLTSNSVALVFCLKPAFYCLNCGHFTVCAKAYSVECAVFIFLCAVTTAHFSVQCVSAVYSSD